MLLNRDEYAEDLKGSGGCPTPVNTVDGQLGGAAVFASSGDRCTFARFGFGDEIQPRLGFNLNVREGKGDKLYGNFGRYYNTDQQSAGRSWAPRRIFQRQARFNAVTGALIDDAPLASTTSKLIDKGLKPTYDDEWLGGFVQDPNRYGPLSQDRPHLFKAFVNYVPVSRLTLGGYLRVQSGAPWNARGLDNTGNGTVLNYLEPAGSHRNPTWTNVDLLAS